MGVKCCECEGIQPNLPSAKRVGSELDVGMTRRSSIFVLEMAGQHSGGFDSGGHFVAGLAEGSWQGGFVLTLPKFIFGMLLVVVAVSIWTAIDGYSLSAVIMRAIACAVILQVGYFVYVLVMVGRERPELTSAKRREQVEKTFPAERQNLPH
jgi:exopolysaccharide production repressor protein